MSNPLNLEELNLFSPNMICVSTALQLDPNNESVKENIRVCSFFFPFPFSSHYFFYVVIMLLLTTGS